jgi:hypothetical protein
MQGGASMHAYIDFVRSNFWEIAFGIWIYVTYTGLSAILKEMRLSTRIIAGEISRLEPMIEGLRHALQRNQNA